MLQAVKTLSQVVTFPSHIRECRVQISACKPTALTGFFFIFTTTSRQIDGQRLKLVRERLLPHTLRFVIPCH